MFKQSSMHIVVCAMTKNKSIHTTTLHSLMNINMICMSRGIDLNMNFITDKSAIAKSLKSCDRLLFFDYGVSVGADTLERLIVEDFPEGYKALVIPCVTENVDWEMFRKKTLDGSSEPVYQRGLSFDISMSPAPKKYADKLYDYEAGECRVFCIDSKGVLKKLRDGDGGNGFKSFEHLKKIGVKIGVLRSAPVICHYVYECVGNILDSSGVRTKR